MLHSDDAPTAGTKPPPAATFHVAVITSGVAAASTQYMPTPVLPTSAPMAQPEMAGRKYRFKLPPDCAYTGRPPLDTAGGSSS